MTIQVLDSQTGLPISNVTVTIIDDAQHNTGDTGITDGKGEVSLQVPRSAVQADRLLVYPPEAGYWGAFRRASPIGPNPLQVGLTPVDPTWIDCLRYVYPSNIGDGAGVRIAIIDKGIEHPDIAVAGGRNTVIDESQTNDYGDNGTDGHGTHLAGIIASAGAAPAGVRGVAPAAEIYSYRAFGQGRQEGSDYSILVAAFEALRDGCHLINLSVATQSDPLLRELDEDIAERGGVCFAAAGNTNGGAVAVPAAFPNTFAVSAMGRQGTLPSGVLEEANIGQPAGSDPRDFFAAFSSCGGAGIDLVAPGVGVISTVPGGGHRPWSGTSQACAAATGAAARLLSGDPVLGRTADRSRSVDMKNLLMGRASPLGFGLHYEGSGRLQ